MSLREKYKSLIELAETSDISELNITEREGNISIKGTASDARVKFRLWEEYGRIDSDFSSDNLKLEIRVRNEKITLYTVKFGDDLRTIGKKFKVNWREIVVTNRAKFGNVIVVHPGQTLTVRHGGQTGTAPPLSSGSSGGISESGHEKPTFSNDTEASEYIPASGQDDMDAESESRHGGSSGTPPPLEGVAED